MMTSRNEEVLREAYMTKRSQNKSRFGPTNWKERWFVLTPHHIIYYDGDRTSGRKKEKGRVELARVEAVERVDTKVFQRDYVFQMVYADLDDEQFVLYIAAWSSHEQDHWVEHIRTLVADNASLSSHVHPGVLVRGQWTCCRGTKETPPCEPASWIPNNNPLPVQAASTPPPPQSNGTMMPVNEEFDVLDDSEEHWWKMRDSQGREGYAPSNYVREKGNLGLQQYEWYLGDASRQRAEAILMREEKEGCFVVRNSTTNSGIYTLSVFSKMSRVQVKHYHIKTDADGMFYLSNSIKCATIPELIYRHQHNPGGLCTRLRNPPSQGRQAPATAGLSHDKWEIVPSELNLLEELGSGQFGVVRHGKLYGIDVAVKMMKEGTMSEDEFIEEAKVMTKLQHPNLVQLYGVCRRKRPIYIVTEYLKHGSLLNYLRNKEKSLIQKPDVLLDMCLQVCEGMAYLESQKFIHRDLAARNCLVGSNNVIKVGDFGLARYVVDDEYTGSGGAKFPIKWAAPEVLNYMRFSSKSDVWAFGVLMWEVSTCGKMPYGRHKNAEVVEMVQQGKILERPKFCPSEVYEVMKKCWLHSQEQRPGFQEIKTEILKVVKTFAE